MPHQTVSRQEAAFNTARMGLDELARTLWDAGYEAGHAAALAEAAEEDAA